MTDILNEETLHKLMKAAEGGDYRAAFELAEAYGEGKGLPKNMERANYWLNKSVELKARAER
ncbi:MAG: SEL1-like repeat protein [Coriobacteriales bacterium]|nr:SEL1-like repeat protein [Coriobacteriales bacterium]